MNKSVIATALAFSMSANTAHAVVNMNSASFTMLDNGGALVGTVDTTVTGTLDTAGGTWSVGSTTPFFGLTWTAHDGTVFGPGTYSFDTIEGDIYTGVVVGAGQLGGHVLFDWGTTFNIDVVNVWDVDCTSLTTCTYASTDGPATNPVNPDGILGYGMLDGAFPTFNANFDFETSAPPTATNDGKSTVIETAATFDLTSNDYATQTPLAAAAVLNPDLALSGVSGITIPGATTLGGTLSDNGDGTVDYRPPAGAVGVTDSFTYTLTDADNRTSAPATVSISITASANNTPVANDVNFATNEDTALTINITDTDNNGTPLATDADDDPLTFASVTQGTNGSVTLNGTSTVVTYTPAANFNGTDTFSFIVNDGLEDSNSGTVTVTVAAVNDPLVCQDITLTASVDTPVDIDVAAELLSTCTDDDASDTVSFVGTTDPAQGGALVFDGANTLTYTPASGFEGADTFTYTASDGTATDTRTVTVNVTSASYGNFTMLDAAGTTFGGTNDIIFDWDGTLNTSVTDTNFNMVMGSESTFPFFGFPWFAHHIRVFGPGTYAFDSSCSIAQLEAGIANCGGGPVMNLTVPAGQIGAHMLFDWNVTENIDVVLLWEENGSFDNPPPGSLYLGPAGPTPTTDAVFRYVSRDSDGDGIPGARMVDGPFIGFRANFNLERTSAGGGEIVAPVSSIDSPSLGGGCSLAPGDTTRGPADWLLLAGFIGLLGWARRRSLH